MATSYAYVNPAVAVLLGVTLGAELVTGPVFIAMPLILGGVAIVTLAQRRQKLAEPEPRPIGEPLREVG
jgi:drug/metabolite transporter (DMT)-like permease